MTLFAEDEYKVCVKTPGCAFVNGHLSVCRDRSGSPLRQVEPDPAGARAARDEGMGRAEDNADTLWQIIAVEVIRTVATKLPEFTTDDVWAHWPEGLDTTHERRAMGPMMVRASKRGYIVPADRVRNSTRRTAHANPKRVWVSLMWDGMEDARV